MPSAEEEKQFYLINKLCGKHIYTYMISKPLTLVAYGKLSPQSKVFLIVSKYYLLNNLENDYISNILYLIYLFT